MGVFDNFVRYVKDIFSRRGLPEFFASMVIMLTTIPIATFTHESGHMITATLMGCKATIGEADYFIGWTGIECPDEMPESRVRFTLMVTALAGPLLAFSIGTYLWFSGEDDLTRALAIPFWWYSTLPNLYIYPPVLDMAVAVQNGLNPLIGMLIFYGIAGFISYATIREIMEKRWISGK